MNSTASNTAKERGIPAVARTGEPMDIVGLIVPEVENFVDAVLMREDAPAVPDGTMGTLQELEQEVVVDAWL
jgi:hypothetical protein